MCFVKSKPKGTSRDEFDRCVELENWVPWLGIYALEVGTGSQMLGETWRWERGEEEEIEQAKDASARDPLWVRSRMSLWDMLNFHIWGFHEECMACWCCCTKYLSLADWFLIVSKLKIPAQGIRKPSMWYSHILVVSSFHQVFHKDLSSPQGQNPHAPVTPKALPLSSVSD